MNTYHVSNANFDDGFGFKGNKVKLVEVECKDVCLDFGDLFWVWDKNHFVVMEPVYFLAERIE